MKFSDAEILPAVVVDNKDPQNIGRIKVAIPGKRDTASICVQNLPWVMPLTQSGYQSFSKQTNGSKVWVINNKANLHEYWYIPMFDMNANTASDVDVDSETDVLLSRPTGTGDAKVKYNSDTGLEMSINDSGIGVKKNGDIAIQGKQSGIEVKEKVIIGSTGDTEPVILSNKFQAEMDKIVDAINDQVKVISNVPYANALIPLLNQIKDIFSGISAASKSENTEMN